MKDQITKLKENILRHITYLRLSRSEEEYLRDLTIILKESDLNLKEMVAVTTATRDSENNPAISSCILRTYRNFSAKGDKVAALVKESISNEIVVLREKGIVPASLPEITQENLYNFTINTSDYLSRVGNNITAKVFDLVEAQLKPLEKSEYCKNLSDAVTSSLFMAVFSSNDSLGDMLVNAITSVKCGVATTLSTNAVKSKVDVDKAYIAAPISSVVYGLAYGSNIENSLVSSAASIAANKTLNLKGTDIAAIIAAGVLGCLNHQGIIMDGISSSLSCAINKNFYRYSEGNVQLEKKNYLSAGLRYYGSKKAAATIMKIAFVSHPILAVATLASLMAVNLYMAEKAKGNIPFDEKEIIAKFSKNLVAVISDLEVKSRKLMNDFTKSVGVGLDRLQKVRSVSRTQY